MIAAVLHLDAGVVAGILILAGCCFAAGWFMRGERDLYRRASGRGNDRGGFISRNPW